MKTRHATAIGLRGSLRVYWARDCSNNLGTGRVGYHNAEVPIGDVRCAVPRIIDDSARSKAFGEVEDRAEAAWPTKCDHCASTVTPDAERQVFVRTLFDTPSGALEPGCLYWARWYHSEDGVCMSPGWTNCTDPRGHLMCTLPNGDQWDIDTRASNCTMPEDKTHRCWVRHGDPDKGEPVHVDKNGATCAAGAGSIQSASWHGFLHNGELHP